MSVAKHFERQKFKNKTIKTIINEKHKMSKDLGIRKLNLWLKTHLLKYFKCTYTFIINHLYTNLNTALHFSEFTLCLIIVDE